MEYYTKCWKKYADFNGRARRQEYWMFVLFNSLFGLGILFIPFIGFFISGIYSLAVFLPGLAVTVRRLHDTGKSGVWYCVVFIPLAGPIWLIILLATEGERNVNMYGEDPKALENYNRQQNAYYFCTKCGGQIPRGIEVCPKCGNYMPESNYR